MVSPIIQRLTKSRRIPVQTGLNLWIRADAQSMPDGTVTPYIQDLSGAGYHLTQATAANRPVFCSWGGPDTKPFFSFDVTVARRMFNASYPLNLRRFACLWVGDVSSLDGAGYMINLGAIDCVVMYKDGAINVYNGGFLVASKIYTGRKVAIVLNLDASNLKVYVDDIASVTSTSAFGASTVLGFSLGDTGGQCFCRVYEVAAYNRFLSIPEITALLAYAKVLYGTGLSQQTPSGRIVFEGDSTTLGYGMTRNRSLAQLINPAAAWYPYGFGVAGQTVTQMSADQSEPNFWANATNWLVFEGGYNDLAAAASGATTEGRINTYLTAAIAAGFAKANIIVHTLSTSGNATERDNCNTLLRANYTGYAGWLVDQAADSQLGVSGSTFTVPGNFFDGVHKNATGYAFQAALIRSTVGGSLPW